MNGAPCTINGFDDLPEGASVAWGTSNSNLVLVSSEGGTAVFRGDYYGECSITGPDFVCGPFASFTFENLPDSSWVNWDRGTYPTDSNSRVIRKSPK